MLRIISPPLGKIRPRIEIFITMVGREIFDIEDVAHGVLVAWNVDLVGIVVVALDGVSCIHVTSRNKSHRYVIYLLHEYARF